MADIFISYAREDAAKVERLVPLLMAAGYTAWWDSNLTSGAHYLKELEAELKAAKAVLVIWSKDSVESHWVADEAAVGRDENRLAAISFDGSMPPLGFRQFQVTDFSHWNGGTGERPFSNLVSALARLASHGEGAAALPTSPRLFAEKRGPLVLGAIALAAVVTIALAGSFFLKGRPDASGLPVDDQAVSNVNHTRTWINGEEFDDCGGLAWCPQMVVVPAGAFELGSPEDEPGRYETEGPQKRVSIRQVGIAKFELTFEQWDACAGRGGCRANPDPSDQGWGRGERPVINVSWDDAQAYVQWLSTQTGKTYRLLSETEWEYVARARSEEPYWWGTMASHERANYGKDQCCGGMQADLDLWMNTAPVGQFPANPFGLHDLNGNVWEWVEDCYSGAYTGTPTDGSAREGDCNERVTRGGSWGNSPGAIRSAARYGIDLTHRDYSLGFRVARVLN